MERKRFDEIFKKDGGYLRKINGDSNVFLGLVIIRKYIPKAGIKGADHDVILSVDIDDILNAGLSEDDAIQLRGLGWMEDRDYDSNSLACFV